MLTLTWLVLTRPAAAANARLELGPDDLDWVDGLPEYPLPSGTIPTSATFSDDRCTPDKDGIHWKLTPAHCPALFRLETAEIGLTGGEKVTIAWTSLSEREEPSFSADGLDPKAAGPDQVAYLGEQGSLQSAATDAIAVLWRTRGGAWARAELGREATAATTKVEDERCETTPKGDELLIVVGHRGGGWVPRFYQGPGGETDARILRPNTPVRVCVEHASNVTIDISLTGARGLSVPTVSKHTGTWVSQSKAGTPATTTTTERFSPRKPGSVDVEIKEGDGASRVVAELEVAEAIAGVVRVGVAIGSVVDADYAVVTAPGSDQSEIVDTLYGSLSPELVVGFAPFFEKNGRIYEIGRPGRWAPYFALGIVEDDPDGGTTLSLLRSVYLGAEFELIRSSSIAATLVAKRVTRLADPFQEGGPADADAELVTRSGYEIGVALVFNLSPEFFEVAGGGAKAKE